MKNMIHVKIKQNEIAKGLPLPSYETSGAAGFDLCAAIVAPNYIRINANGGVRVVPTGLSVEIPDGYEIQIRSRSGLAAKHHVTVLNSPGTIDADYRGEIGVVLVNNGSEDFVIERGMRIAQGVLAPVARAVWLESSDLSDSERGVGGFGSTGTKSQMKIAEEVLQKNAGVLKALADK